MISIKDARLTIGTSIFQAAERERDEIWMSLIKSEGIRSHFDR